jgi:hypothetical protein
MNTSITAPSDSRQVYHHHILVAEDADTAADTIRQLSGIGYTVTGTRIVSERVDDFTVETYHVFGGRWVDPQNQLADRAFLDQVFLERIAGSIQLSQTEYEIMPPKVQFDRDVIAKLMLKGVIPATKAALCALEVAA